MGLELRWHDNTALRYRVIVRLNNILRGAIMNTAVGW